MGVEVNQLYIDLKLYDLINSQMFEQFILNFFIVRMFRIYAFTCFYNPDNL